MSFGWGSWEESCLSNVQRACSRACSRGSSGGIQQKFRLQNEENHDQELKHISGNYQEYISETSESSWVPVWAET